MPHFEASPQHVYGASSLNLINFLPRVSGASLTMSDKRPPHVYGASSPHRRNIIPHIETSPQHVYGASSAHLKNFPLRVSGASFTMSDKRAPHVYGAFSPLRRNILPHFEAVPSARLRSIHFHV